MKEEYRKIFDSLNNEKEDPYKIDVNSKVLIIDSLNTFIRSFAMIQHVNYHGNHIGGLTGFLRSLGYVVNMIRPTRVILVFDGQGSSTNKRYLYPEYKANRGISRITNWDMFESQGDESEAIKNQIVRLIDYLKCLPVDLVSVDKIEADDVIGFLTKKLSQEVIVMSSDRDFLQLVNERVTVYSPIKKKFYDKQLVKKEYGVSTSNFLNQKIVLGDSGDNVPGVKGIGEKTFSKLFPEMSEDRRYTLKEMLEKCEKESKPKYKDILLFKEQLQINEKLMDLHDPNIPEKDTEYLLSLIDNPNKGFLMQEFISLYHEDSLGESIRNLNRWLFDNFTTLSKYGVQ
jgi:DNA polymerase-1